MTTSFARKAFYGVVVVIGVCILTRSTPLRFLSSAYAGGPGDPECHGIPYDPITQGCCDDGPFDLDSEGCCGGHTYDLSFHKCCNVQIVPQEYCCR
jgi:hypothetical protein